MSIKLILLFTVVFICGCSQYPLSPSDSGPSTIFYNGWKQTPTASTNRWGVISSDGSPQKSFLDDSDFIVLSPPRSGRLLYWAFDENRYGKDHRYAIRIANIDGSNARDLLINDYDIDQVGTALLSHNAQRVFFASRDYKAQQNFLNIMNADGSHRIRLPFDGTISAAEFSPDDRLIAFQGDDLLFLMNPDGTGLRIAAENISGYGGRSFSWSPDSRSIVFIANAAPTSSSPWIASLSRLDLASGRITKLSGAERFYEVSWSPRGDWIAVTGDTSTTWNCNLWLIRPDGSEWTRLAGDTTTAVFASQWSSDGTQLLFIADPYWSPLSMGPRANDGVLSVIDLSTLQSRALAPGTRIGYWAR